MNLKSDYIYNSSENNKILRNIYIYIWISIKYTVTLKILLKIIKAYLNKWKDIL